MMTEILNSSNKQLKLCYGFTVLAKNRESEEKTYCLLKTYRADTMRNFRFVTI